MTKTATKSAVKKAVKKTVVKDEKELSPMDKILKALDDKYGDDGGLGSEIIRPEKISTGSLIIDEAFKGGFVRGKIINTYAAYGFGKSALAFKFLSQIKGPKGFIDAESAYDKETAEMYGVDTTTLIVREPAYIEQGMEMVMDMIKLGCEAVVFDSVAGIDTKAEAEEAIDSNGIGRKAKRMGQLMRKLHIAARKANCTVFFINQIRDVIGSPVPMFTTPGGHALKFHASYNLEGKKKKPIKTGEEQIGHYMTIKLEKNKFGTPNMIVNIPIIYGYGISREWEIKDLAMEKGILEKGPSWYSYEGNKIANGDYKMFQFLLDNPEFTEELLTKIRHYEQ